MTKLEAPDPTASILSVGITTCNIPVAFFFFFFATLKPTVLPLPTLCALEHSISFLPKKESEEKYNVKFQDKNIRTNSI